MFAIKCPNCGTNTYMSLDEPIYDGPFKCWKCKGTFTLKIEGEETIYCQPISEEEFQQYLDGEFMSE